MTKRGPLLITGAGGGIGLATALAAAKDGWEVHAGVRAESDLFMVARAAQLNGVNLSPVILDVTNEDECVRVVESIKPLALVNNAGFASAGAIEETNVNIGRNHLEVMTVAPTRLAQLALPFMHEAGFGRIVNISSLGGRTSAPLTGWYTASKHALESLTDSLRMEVASDNIGVSLIEPGGISSGLLDKAVNATDVDENSKFAVGLKRAEMLTKLTLRFQSEPESVARKVVRALGSQHPRARYVVGIDARLLLLGGRVFPLVIRDRFKRKVLAL